MKLPRALPRIESIQTKLLAYFIVLVLLPVITLGVFGPVIYARSVENEKTEHTTQMIDQVSKRIESSVFELEKLIDFLSLRPEVQLFYEQTGTEWPNEDSDKLRGEIESIRRSHPEIAGILILNNADLPFSPDLERVTKDPLTSEKWFAESINDPDRVHVFSRPIGRNLRNLVGYSDDEIVSVVKAYRHPKTKNVVGVILIDLRVSVISEIFQNTSLGNKGFLFVSDALGGTVYAPLNKIIYRIPVSEIKGQKGPVFFSIETSSEDSVDNKSRGREDFTIFSQASVYTGWNTTAVISVDETLKAVSNIKVFSIIIGLLTLVLALVAAVFFTNSIARPVIKLESLMKKAESGDLSVRFQSQENDEVSRLGGSFNTMIGEIQKLIGQVYEDQKIQRETELRMLQEQIKPHFLYNTLDTIQWMAREHGATEIVGVVESLTSLFRTGLSKGKEMIKLSEEIGHVQSYLYIQKARYEDKFDWKIEADETTLDFFVLKLVLQPLVENAIYHGVKERRGKGQIMVTANVSDDHLIMRVIDDGAGMSKEKFENLNSRLAGNENPLGAEGYGIFNVNERITLSFGNEFGLRFIWTDQEGCIVELRHPLIREYQ